MTYVIESPTWHFLVKYGRLSTSLTSFPPQIWLNWWKRISMDKPQAPREDEWRYKQIFLGAFSMNASE